MEYDSEFDDEDDMQMLSDQSDGIENAYYNAKAWKEDDPQRALAEFAAVANSEPGSEWAVKSAKQTLKVQVRLKSNFLDSFVAVVRELDRVGGEISDSYRDKSFTNMAQLAERHGSGPEMYEQALQVVSSDRLKMRVRLSLARYQLDMGRIAEAEEAMQGQDDIPGSGNGLELEYLALKMQLALANDEWANTEHWYARASSVKTPIAAPRILAVIREVGAISGLRKHQWELSLDLLLRSFKGYDELGRPDDRLRVLRLYVLSALVTEKNPFDLPEIKAFEIELSVEQQLARAFLEYNVAGFRTAMSRLRAPPHLLPDLLQDVVGAFEARTLIWLVQPFSRVRYSYLADKLQIDTSHLETLLTQMLLDGRLPMRCRLNDVDEVVERANPVREFGVQASHVRLPARFGQEMAARAQKQAEQQILRQPGAESNEEPIQTPANEKFRSAQTRLLAATRALHTAIVS